MNKKGFYQFHLSHSPAVVSGSAASSGPDQRRPAIIGRITQLSPLSTRAT